VGWNQVRQPRPHWLLDGIEDQSFFYFVHSFYCDPADPTIVVGETDYGGAYASVVAQGQIFGVQFHPEKSQSAGLRLLGNFARTSGRE
jgi:glutamine amidotransferase